MRFVHFTIFVCALSFSIQSGSSSYILDVLQQAINTKVGVIKDLPKRIPTLGEIFEFGKNALFGFPLELVVNVIHEFCKYSVCSSFNSIKKHMLNVCTFNT